MMLQHSLLPGGGIDVSIDFGSQDTLVPQHLLHHTEIGAILYQMRRETVAESMRGNLLVDTRGQSRRLHHVEHGNTAQGPAETVEKILNRIEKDATWMVISVYKNGRGWQLFREGYKINEEDLTEREREWLESWVFAAYNSGLFQKRKKK